MFYTQNNCKHSIKGVRIASLACNEPLLDQLESTLPKGIRHFKEEELDIYEGQLVPDIIIVGSSWTPSYSVRLGFYEGSNKAPVVMILEKEDAAVRLKARKHGVVDFLKLEALSESLPLSIQNLLKLTCPSSNHQAAPHDQETRAMMRTIDYLLKQKPALSVADFCAHQKISQPSLYRKVKKAVGVSPAQLIMDRRCQQAAGLLTSTKIPISQIAYQSGFNSPAHFSKVFKKSFGKSPKIYRNDYS